MTRYSRLRMQSGIAANNAATTAHLLEIKRLEERERFIDGVIDASAIHELRSDVFASDVAAAYNRKESSRG